jgi:hypothetical protein
VCTTRDAHFLLAFRALNVFFDTVSEVFIIEGKGNAVSLEAWSGPEGSRKLRFPDFMTTAQDGGKVVSLTHRPPKYLQHRPKIYLEGHTCVRNSPPFKQISSRFRVKQHNFKRMQHEAPIPLIK